MNHSTMPGVKRTRGRTGCLNCRARKKKCDEVKPMCSRCVSCNDTCKWDESFPFRSVGIIPENSSVLQSPTRQKGPQIKIVDVRPEHGIKRRRTEHQQSEDEIRPELGAYTDDERYNNLINEASSTITSSERLYQLNDDTVDTPNQGQQDLELLHQADGPSLTRDSTRSQESNTVQRSLDDTIAGSPLRSVERNNDTIGYNHTDLGALDFLTSHTSNIDVIASALQEGGLASWSPEDLDLSTFSSHAGDSLGAGSPDSHSVYYSNATYRKLHSTLHQQIVQTARTTALNRRNSVEAVLTIQSRPSHLARQTSGSSREEALKAPGQLKCELVSPRRQLELWRNYLNEIAPWLDLIDEDRHFQIAVPNMAKEAPHLHYSILALSARQIERRSSQRTYTESLGLYQQAIQMIVHRLQHLETDVIASCVLLCVLEMMSSSPRAWARHLNGCAMLLEAAGINGVVGGVRQAIFWCFARMDLWGGYLGDTLTKISTNRWFIPSGSMASAVHQLKHGSSVDAYANYAVFLCASVVNVISTQETIQSNNRAHNSDSQGLYHSRWKALYDLLEDWYDDRPEELLPLMSEQPAVDDYESPFPIVLYVTSPGVSSNQMYHTAALLMLQQKPRDLRLPKSRKSILWHARQICGIATSNTDHSAWTNALQPLWMAGKVMSHPSEHRAILSVLSRIEKETGFATKWRANDLKEYWGDDSD